jgi:hypothetical protein
MPSAAYCNLAASYEGGGPTVTRKGELSQFYHVAITADKVQGHRNYDAMYGFAGASSVAPRTFSMRRDDLDFVVFCLAKPEDAEAFCGQFGGERERMVPSLRSSRPLKKPLVAMSVGAPSDNVTAPHPSAAGVEADSGLRVAEPRRKRHPTEDEHRALQLLAGVPRGTNEEVLILSHGFKLQMLIGLVQAKLAKRYRVTVKAGTRTIGVSYMIITAAGRKAIGG